MIRDKDLPSGSEGVPAVYEVGGREYLAVRVAAGKGTMTQHVVGDEPAVPPWSGAYMVFAVPKK